LAQPIASQDKPPNPPLSISADGRVAVGSTGTSPVAPLDVAPVARTYPGNHPKSVRSLYVTGDLPEGRPDEDETPAIEFRHTNGSQGIGFGYNTIYATGSNANQDLNLSPRGTGKVEVTAPLSVTGTITGQGAVPVGAIMMWSGDVKSLPKGW